LARLGVPAHTISTSKMDNTTKSKWWNRNIGHEEI
jgi:hypothetical protein